MRRLCMYTEDSVFSLTEKYDRKDDSNIKNISRRIPQWEILRLMFL